MAGAGRRVFTPGEVLTASNTMSYLMDQSVMVFDDAAARGSAIGTAVVSEGMTTYLKDVDQIQFYDGSDWRFVTGGSALPIANGGTGGTSVATAQDNLGIGLIPVAPTSVTVTSGTATATSLGVVTFSGTTTVDINGVFSADYTNYRVHISRGFSSSSNIAIKFRFLASGTAYIGNQYYQQGALYSGTNAPSAYSAANATWFDVGVLPTGSTEDYFSSSLDVFNPFIAKNKIILGQAYGYGTLVSGYTHNALVGDQTARDGFRLFTNTAATMSGRVQVFGYNE